MHCPAYITCRILRIPPALAVLSSLVSLAAAAPAPPVEKKEEEKKTLPEMLILGEALGDPQDKPVSASFLPDKDVEAFKIREPQDIARVTPNMSATDSGSRSFGDVYTTRGIANTVFFGAPSTTVYVDDVPFGETFTYAQYLTATNSVEVLRGPQPNVVGRYTSGGLITSAAAVREMCSKGRQTPLTARTMRTALTCGPWAPSRKRSVSESAACMTIATAT
ncbi:MAG TPA: Plug domain-containing protein [Verrucomicrobiales bacterium]|nr:Plug domain-containing protein [Verrucomicrobiales bacterium]